MRALIVFESMFGNTEEVAHAVAEGLAATLHVDVMDVNEAPTELPSDVVLVVVGGPTHAFSMSRATTRADAVRQGGHGSPQRGIRDWLDMVHLQGDGPQLVTFDTRVAKARRLPGSAAKSAAREARHRGFRSVARGSSFFVVDTQGPLLDGEVQRAAEWGRDLARRVLERSAE